MNKKIIAAAAVAGAVISLIAGLSGNAGPGGLFGKSIISAMLWAAAACGIAVLLRKTVPGIENVLSETTAETMAETTSFPGKGSMLDISDSEIPEENNYPDDANQEMMDNNTEDAYSGSDETSSFQENNSASASDSGNTSAASDKGTSSFTISRNADTTDFSDLEERFSSGGTAAGTDISGAADKAISESAATSSYSTSAQSRQRGDTSKIEEEFRKQDPQILAKMVRSELKK